MPTPIFPWLRVTGNRVVSGLVKIPTLSVNRLPMGTGSLAEFGKNMFNENISASEMPSHMRDLLKSSPDAYKSGYYDALKPIVENALDAQSSSAGLDPTAWSDVDKRAAHTIDLSPSDGGHAMAVVTFEPMSGASDRISDPRVLRSFAGSFPGNFAALTDSMFLNALNSGREIDGTPTSWTTENWDAIAAHNSQLFRDKEPMSGMHMIGANSFVGSEGHFSHVGGDFSYQSALLVTAAVHSQDGVIPWTAVSHPDFPDGMICMSIHFGENAVPGGDAINAEIAAPLFKSVFRRGCRLVDLYPSLVEEYGEATASKLLLDPVVASAFRQVWWEEDWRVLADTALLSTLDQTGGKLLNDLRLFSPNTVATIDSSRYLELTDASGFQDAVDDGVKKTESDGYIGAGGLEASDKDAEVADMTTAVVGWATPTSDIDAFAPDAPLPSGFSDAEASMQEMTSDIDWKFLQTEIDTLISQKTQEQLDTLSDPYTSTNDELVDQLNTDALRQNVLDTTNALILESVANDSSFSALVSEYGIDGAKSLASLVSGIPTMDQLSKTVSGDSYLEASIRKTVLDGRAHELSQQASEIQEQLTTTSSALSTTTSEVSAKQSDLEEVDEQLEQKPDDPTLQEQQAELQKELSDLVEQQKEQQAELEKAESDQANNAEEQKETSESRATTDDYISTRGSDVFEGK